MKINQFWQLELRLNLVVIITFYVSLIYDYDEIILLDGYDLILFWLVIWL